MRADSAVLVFVYLTALRTLGVELLEYLVVVGDVLTAQESVDYFTEREQLLTFCVGAVCLDSCYRVTVPFFGDAVALFFFEILRYFRAESFVLEYKKSVRGHTRVDRQIGVVIH